MNEIERQPDGPVERTPLPYKIAAFFVTALVSTWPTTDPDLWWHLADGRYFAANGVPDSDPFSLTRVGSEWVAHEWLADIFMFRVVEAVGLTGLAVVYGLIVGLAWLLIYTTVPGEPIRKLFLVGLAAAGIAPVVAARPQMNTLFLLAVLIALTERIRTGRTRPVAFWWLVPMVVLWANLHAGFYTAFAYLGVVAVGGLIERRLDPVSRTLDSAALGHLAGAMVVAFFAILLTPHGATLWTYPFATLGDPVTQRSLVEWRSPAFGNFFLWGYLAYVVVGLLGIAVRRPRPVVTDLILYAGTLAASLFSVRHIALHAVVSMPMVMRLWTQDRTTQVSRLFPVALLVVAIGGYWVQFNRLMTINESSVTARFPVDAVTYLQESGLSDQRIYNDFPWGGYLIWNDIRPFIDGRTDMYGPEYLDMTLDTLFLRSGWEASLDVYDIDVAMLTHTAPLTRMLETLPEWSEVYRDDRAVIFERRDRA